MNWAREVAITNHTPNYSVIDLTRAEMRCNALDAIYTNYISQ